MPLRVTLRQSFPTAKEKETRLPHTVLAGEEMEVYDVNTLAHTFCVISAPSVLRGGCSTEKNAIHIKSIWCDGSETAPTRRPRDREVEVDMIDSRTGAPALSSLRVRMTDNSSSLASGGSGPGPMRVEISSRLWVVNLTGIPLEFGASNGSSRLGTVSCALLPPTNELPDTCARVVNVSDDVVGLRLKCAAGGAGGMPCAWSDEEIPIDRPGMSIDVSTRARRLYRHT